jgi:Protein of unknown function, DUF547
MKQSLLILLLVCALFIPNAVDAADFLYSNYEQLLEQHVKTGVAINGIRVNAVDYTALKHEALRPDSTYSRLLSDLTAFDPETLGSREERIAFWINVYNIAAIKTIVDHYPVDSIRSRKINWLGLPWNRKAITVGGKEYALGEIESDLLVEGFRDLRVHFGINCASVSCVDLLAEPFRANKLYRQLEEKGKRFLADTKKGMRIDRSENTVYLSQVFKFDKKHFDAYAGSAMKFIMPYVPEADQEYLRSGGYGVEYLDYDWNANDLKNAK